jgi:hypothetical protein
MLDFGFFTVNCLYDNKGVRLEAVGSLSDSEWDEMDDFANKNLAPFGHITDDEMQNLEEVFMEL